MSAPRKYWFPAKRHGWGWGLPATWQGWTVLAGFMGLLWLGAIIFPPAGELRSYLVYVGVLCGLLVALCWRKGEPPRWR